MATAELALDATGKFLAVRVKAQANYGAYVSMFAPTIPTTGLAKVISGLYRIPAIRIDFDCAFTNTVPVDAIRGAGKPEALFLLERLVDIAAHETGRTPADLRRLNLLRADEMPYAAASGYTYDAADCVRLFETALKAADEPGFANRRSASEAAGKRRGLGFACHLHGTGGIADEHVVVHVGPDRLVASVGTQSQGQGHETVFAQILSKSLGVPVDRIEVRQGDTRTIPHGGGTGGSSSTIISGTTLKRAADVVIQRGRDLAAERLETAPADIAYRDGAFEVVGTDRRIGLFELAARKPFEGDALFGDKIESFPTGVMVCEVEVDPETGGVRVDRLTAVADCGVVVNPRPAGRPDAWRHRAWAGQRADGGGRLRRGDRPAAERHPDGLCPAARRRRARSPGRDHRNALPQQLPRPEGRRRAADQRRAGGARQRRARRAAPARRPPPRHAAHGTQGVARNSRFVNVGWAADREKRHTSAKRRWIGRLAAASMDAMLRWISLATGALVLIVVGAFAGVIAFDSPAAPPVLAAGNSIPESPNGTSPSCPSRRASRRATARRSTTGSIPAVPDRAVVLVHGSTGSGVEMLKLAQALQAAGATVYAISLRGHGGSGTANGDVSYRGQLDDDLADLVKGLGLDKPGVHRTLAGFSSGGGLVLRIAGGPQANLFDDYLAISPYVAQDSPTSKPNAGGWAGVAVPRIVALSLLDGFGLPWFQGLPAVHFATAAKADNNRTPVYSFRLMASLQLGRDWRAFECADSRSWSAPMTSCSTPRSSSR